MNSRLIPLPRAACIRRGSDLVFQPLPESGDAADHDEAFHAAGLRSKVYAAAAFDTDEFVAGTVSLKPLCQKDSESTHGCSQVFCVIACQPGALHVTMGGKSFLLSPGDHFFVPQSTQYRLRNFSKHTLAAISFCLVKPRAIDEEDDDGVVDVVDGPAAAAAAAVAAGSGDDGDGDHAAAAAASGRSTRSR